MACALLGNCFTVVKNCGGLKTCWNLKGRCHINSFLLRDLIEDFTCRAAVDGAAATGNIAKLLLERR